MPRAESRAHGVDESHLFARTDTTHRAVPVLPRNRLERLSATASRRDMLPSVPPNAPYRDALAAAHARIAELERVAAERRPTSTKAAQLAALHRERARLARESS